MAFIDFESLKGGNNYLCDEVSIRRDGTMYVGKKTLADFGAENARYAELYIDDKKPIVALKFKEENKRNGKSVALTAVVGYGATVGIIRVLKHYGIELTKAVRVGKKEQDGMLVIDLSDLMI